MEANDVLDRLEKLLAEATAGPWTASGTGAHITMCISTFARKAAVGTDLNLIVALRNAAPALIRLARAAIAVTDWKEGDGSLLSACDEHDAAIKALGEVKL